MRGGNRFEPHSNDGSNLFYLYRTFQQDVAAPRRVPHVFHLRVPRLRPNLRPHAIVRAVSLRQRPHVYDAMDS